MGKIDIEAAPRRDGTAYPEPFDVPCRKRSRQRLGLAAGLTQFGVNRLTLPPGQWSSQRHWHTHEDEFVFVVEGEVVLVTDAGEQVLKAGDCAGFPHGVADGHHIQNRSDRDAILLEIGHTDPADGAFYPDIDLEARPDAYYRRDGTPYPATKRVR